MNSEVIIGAVNACLNSLESFVTATILLAIAVIWPALRNRDTLEFLSMKVERQYAFPVLSMVYIFLNTAILILFLRLCFLVDLLGHGIESAKALDTIVTHSWILNPYSYFGKSLPAVLYASTTYGLLIVVWWFCFASLHALGDSPGSYAQKLTEGIFLAIGVAAMGAMQWAGILMYLRIDSDLRGYEGIHAVFVGKAIMSFVSIGLGAILFGFIARMRSLLLQVQPTTQKM
jgi:hypothetical protein